MSQCPRLSEPHQSSDIQTSGTSDQILGQPGSDKKPCKNFKLQLLYKCEIEFVMNNVRQQRDHLVVIFVHQQLLCCTRCTCCTVEKSHRPCCTLLHAPICHFPLLDILTTLVFGWTLNILNKIRVCL